MHYTTRLGDRPTQAHVNYECPCGCIAGLTYDRESGAEHLGRCCCGRLLWVGTDAETQVREAQEPGTAYEIEPDTVTLPWGERVSAVLAVPAYGLPPAAVAAPPASGERVRDVVCNMRIFPEDAAATSVYGDVTYYFCAAICKQRFDQDPRRFLAEEARS